MSLLPLLTFVTLITLSFPVDQHSLARWKSKKYFKLKKLSFCHSCYFVNFDHFNVWFLLLLSFPFTTSPQSINIFAPQNREYVPQNCDTLKPIFHDQTLIRLNFNQICDTFESNIATRRHTFDNFLLSRLSFPLSTLPLWFHLFVSPLQINSKIHHSISYTIW